MKRSGQALVMVTLALFMLCGLLGLAVDLSWAYFVKKSAQGAADAAALAAAVEALSQAGQAGSFVCGGRLGCQADTACPATVAQPPSNNLEAGCLYGIQNGFPTAGRQKTSMEAGINSPPPTAPGVVVEYWVTARAAQTIPQLFASVLSPSATASARATAAVVGLAVSGSMALLNRDNDCLPMENPNNLTCGVNLLVSSNDNQGQPAVRADGGILMASQKHGATADGRFAGENSGGGTVQAPYTSIRGNGGYKLTGSSQWIETPQNRAEEDLFADPMSGRGQPRPPSGLPNHEVPGGILEGSTDPANPLLLAPGNYYTTATDRSGQTYATGDPIKVRGYVQFSNNGSGFGSYVLFGGVQVDRSGSIVTFEPGQYILAGVKGSPGALFSVTTSATIQDLTSGYGQNFDAGEIFIFTDTNYRGQGQSLQLPPLVAPIADQLKQGTTGFQTGSSAPGINLHGLNRNAAALPADWRQFAPVVVWQDQANSVVKYTQSGNIDVSCGDPDGCPNTSLANNQSPQLVLQASPQVHLYGTVYQPRGTWLTINGGGSYAVPVQVITGAVRVQGNATFSMIRLPGPVTRRAVVLVE